MADISDRLSWRRLAMVAGIPFALSVLMALVCQSAAGTTLGLWFGGVGMATLLAPGLVLAEKEWLARLLAGAAIVDGVGLIWLISIFDSPVSLGQWLGAYGLLATYTLAIVGVALVLERVRLPRAAAAAIAVLLGCAWLSWPIWLAPWLTGAARGQVVAGLVWGHPVFGINGWLWTVYPIPWAQHSLAYAWTNIGDDIPYTMPKSIWPSLFLHLTAGIALLLASVKKIPTDQTPELADP